MTPPVAVRRDWLTGEASRNWRDTAQLVDELLTTVGAAHLTQLIVESVHTQADHLAMVGRADEALALRRYVRVIWRAARELTTAARVIPEDRGV